MSSGPFRRQRLAPPVVALALAVAGIAPAAAARGKSAVTFQPNYATAPSYEHAALSAASCLARLTKQKIAFERVAKAPGVLAPVRIVDGVSGVLYRTELPRDQGRTSPWEVFDCRLVLSLVGLSKILRKHGIDEVRMFSAWRPPPKRWPKGKLAVRHPGALAIDIKRFGRPNTGEEPKTGTELEKAQPKKAQPKKVQPKKVQREWLVVEDLFNGHIGDTTCGAAATPADPAAAETAELRKIVCEVAAARVFTSILTPNYDRAHFNHFHFDLAVDVKWRLVR